MKAKFGKSGNPRAPAAKRGRPATARKTASKPARALYRGPLVLPDPAETCMVTVDSAGRILVPAKMRKELSMKPGDKVELSIRDGLLEVSTVLHWVRSVQAMAAKHKVKGRSMVKELIAERRAEAKREEEESA